MSEPFLGQITMVGFNFAPRGWAFCDGQILPINQNQSLYSLLGTTYGGDGRTTFALPDLRGRVPIHVSNSHPLGQKGGAENVLIDQNTMPSHTHPFKATNDSADRQTPEGNLIGQVPAGFGNAYAGTANTALNEAAISKVGGGQAHNNMQPSNALRFCIALQGLFPSRN